MQGKGSGKERERGLKKKGGTEGQKVVNEWWVKKFNIKETECSKVFWEGGARKKTFWGGRKGRGEKQKGSIWWRLKDVNQQRAGERALGEKKMRKKRRKEDA